MPGSTLPAAPWPTPARAAVPLALSAESVITNAALRDPTPAGLNVTVAEVIAPVRDTAGLNVPLPVPSSAAQVAPGAIVNSVDVLPNSSADSVSVGLQDAPLSNTLTVAVVAVPPIATDPSEKLPTGIIDTTSPLL